MMHFRSWIYFGCRNFKKFLVIVPIKNRYSINHQVFRIYIYLYLYISIYIYLYIYRNSIDIPKKYGQHPARKRPKNPYPMATPMASHAPSAPSSGPPHPPRRRRSAARAPTAVQGGPGAGERPRDVAFFFEG